MPLSTAVPRCAAGPTDVFTFSSFWMMNMAGEATNRLQEDGDKCWIS